MYSLGTLLMARSGLSTRTVRMADRLALWPSSEYSNTLRTESERQGEAVLLYLKEKFVHARTQIYQHKATTRKLKNTKKYNNAYNNGSYPHNYCMCES